MADSTPQAASFNPALRVVIAGCGIAGPALACFLKKQGYEPVVYEKTKAHSVTSGGSSLMLQINGIKVINLISPEIVKKLTASPAVSGKPMAQVLYLSQVSGEEIIRSDAPSQYLDTPSADGAPPLPFQIGVRRTTFHQMLIEEAQSQGISIHFEKELTAIKQDDSSMLITAIFTDDTQTSGSFLVGCDGVHSATRAALFGKEPATYTGLTQTAGLSLTPPSLAPPNNPATFLNVFGNSSHVVSYPISDTQTSWAVTVREAESRETWRAMGKEQQDAFCRDAPYKDWKDPVNEFVKEPEHVIKYGLYDRPELAKWHQGRVVLLGDAAHPTSPHLGQGANQAFEDIYHLDRLLQAHIPSPNTTTASTTLLDKIFTEFETLRIARTSVLVKAARAQGEMRVVSGEKACLARDQTLKSAVPLLAGKAMEELKKHPF
ncbi:hypothetical protein FRB97_002638 [Tulasnella sp. 331]|nr:hypothetical protein FRB97_002638 [Tulasnella sp. 331]